MIKTMAILSALTLASMVAANPLRIADSDVTFVAVGKPGFLKINGKGGTLQGQLQRQGQDMIGEVHVTMDKFVTGIDLRDEHMKKNYFEVAKYPEAVLKLTQLAWKGGSQKDVPFKGLLNFHGVEKPMEGTVDIDVDKNRYAFVAKFPMMLSDYKIDIPSYAGVKVADKVDIRAEFHAEEKP